MLIRIMACKEREENIKKMLSSLPKETEVIWDTDNNACHTLCKVVDSDEPMLVMEDDIELCKDFFEKATSEITKRPDSFIMFYSSGRWENKMANLKRDNIPYTMPFVFTQAYYIPAWIGKKMSKFLETNHRANNHRWSIGINQFLIKEWIKRYLVYPSLVQHIGYESVLEPWMFKIHHSKSYKYI